MNSTLCFTLRFLDPVPQFHGRGADGNPEWPPSPLRFFQALVSASAKLQQDDHLGQAPSSALRWLEQIPPALVAPRVSAQSFGHRKYVPNNSGDLMTAAWDRGNTDTSMAEYRVEKDFRPTNMREDALHFLFTLHDGKCPYFDVLRAAARSMTHLGWGTDMVSGNAELLTESEVNRLNGEVWQPVAGPDGAALRVPIGGTFDALNSKYSAFLDRIRPDGFQPVPPLSSFRVINYRRATDPPPRMFAAFRTLASDASRMRAFDTPRRTREVAGMVRHAVAEVAHRQGWSDEKINVFIHGKTPDGRGPAVGTSSPDRFQYLPLPTINHGLGRVESIRRVLIAAPAHCRQEIDWVQRALAGEELKSDHGKTEALLTILQSTEWVLQQYVRQSKRWSTVTPLILPGYDDCNSEKGGKLLRSAFIQAGYSKELIDQSEFEWRRVGFRAGVDLASRYLPPENIANRPRYHVRIQFPTVISGPLAIGSGRFRGFGLFAREDD